MTNSEVQASLDEIESESLKEVLTQILEQQKLTSDRLKDLENEINAWGSWLRTGSGAIIFIVSISFLGVLIGLLLPICLNLYRNL